MSSDQPRFSNGAHEQLGLRRSLQNGAALLELSVWPTAWSCVGAGTTLKFLLNDSLQALQAGLLVIGTLAFVASVAFGLRAQFDGRILSNWAREEDMHAACSAFDHWLGKFGPRRGQVIDIPSRLSGALGLLHRCAAGCGVGGLSLLMAWLIPVG